jgi:hypothetical protein
MNAELTPAKARIELALLDGKALSMDRTDIFVRFTNVGIPPEIVFRLEELWDASKIIGKKVVHIGRIVILEIVRFIEENPNLAIGVALGAAVGSLTSLVPYIGYLLAPISVAVGAFIGGMAGARLDRGQEPGSEVIGLAQDVIIFANKFFSLLASIFIALKQELSAE